MTDDQWQILLQTIRGAEMRPLPIGFIIDSPWLPNWYGQTIRDYFGSDEIWLQANLKVVREFPELLFLPGFWSEFGMCTEPSAFGARCSFPEDAFPHAHAVLRSSDDIRSLPSPDPRTDGLLPFVLGRLHRARPAIEKSGHAIRFAVARGPLNIACYLMGTTEFLTALKAEPERAYELLGKITGFLGNWIDLQRVTFPSIDGILLLDDIIGFLGPEQFRTFGLPHFTSLFAPDVAVRFLHNDAPCRVSAPFLPEMRVNLFNMGFDITLNELRRLAGPGVTLLGNIPPRDVLARGGPEDIATAVRNLVGSLDSTSRVIVSCGGGMPPGVTSESIHAFERAVRACRG